jgi:hypothetical protein
MWLFAMYWNPLWASLFGWVWVLGRIVYFLGYVSAPEKRAAGFLIQSIAVFALSFGALGRIVYLAAGSSGG